ncbi:MAG TPA: peptidase M19 [Caldithrix abyssi]|uniref:Peptidase M19 n=1 Tax=Caldithrix abyssi TaxID=187145 RepID=A0A7V1LKQ1_CALAY|nr:peptidase M19 [Caldithrix abyssi]
MTTPVKRILQIFWGLLLLAIIIFFTYLPTFVDKQFNILLEMKAPTLPDSVKAFHSSLRAADMHDDILLWGRDLTEKHDYGHTDLPRLRAGNIRLQVFSVVTKTPSGINYQSNNAETDQITLLMIAQMAPVKAWYSLTERALYQANRLRETAAGFPGQLAVVSDRKSLNNLLNNSSPDKIAGVLAIEGMHALDGKLENLEVLDRAGYRMIGLAHFFDNAFAGSAHGEEKYGLTELGKQAFREMEKRHILIDLAHASPRAIEDALELATRPLVVSHTGVKENCDSPRNLSDDQLRRIAATGGLIGIGFWSGAVCDSDVESVVDAMLHAVEIAGIDHVALGSDWDGATREEISADRLPWLTAALLNRGMSKDDVRKIMGENLIRLLLATLPE